MERRDVLQMDDKRAEKRREVAAAVALIRRRKEDEQQHRRLGVDASASQGHDLLRGGDLFFFPFFFQRVTSAAGRGCSLRLSEQLTRARRRKLERTVEMLCSVCLCVC